MLVLSRRPQQSLLIGHDVVITVLEVNGDTVRIGISAPPEVQIHREEVYRDLQRSNREAAASPSGAADFSRRLKPRRPDEVAGDKEAGKEAEATPDKPIPAPHLSAGDPPPLGEADEGGSADQRGGGTLASP